ncbi:solute carrier family 22 member 11 isoform X2 [Pteropus medius]|uniref:solute carrier family 22 member 11 isoform X2 n=1 Tax=Pteropus vampyrus TaxID=132908 RepID=UPI00196B47F9|nr:solute carrier family 22 member 11 isoform X2 [Pteropus giganteus]
MPRPQGDAPQEPAALAMAFSELLERAGGMGLFQALQVFTILLISSFIPPQLLMDIFLAATPGHRCWVRMLDNGSEVPTNLTPEALLAVSIPLGPNREPDQCRRFRQLQWQLLEPNATATNWSEAATEPCVDGWVYDLSTFSSTIVAEWGLVCASQNLKPMGQGVMMAGFLLGFLAWGLLSYWFGRKPILSWCCLQVAVANTSTIFAPNFFIYCGLRFLSTFGLAGVLMTTTTLVVEWTTTRWVDLTVTILGCTYGIGHMALGGLAFVLRDWRALNLALSTPFFAFFLISWWLPESVRWLIMKGKPDRALQVLKKVARINGHKEVKKTLTREVLLSSMKEELASGKTRYSMLDLFRVPSLRLRSSCMSIVSFCVMISYYGLVLDLQSLGSDIFLLQFLFGVMDFLSRSTCTFLLRFFSRRTLIASFLAMAGLFILGNVLVPQDFQTLRVIFAVLGKGCFAVTLTTVIVYKSELFPTPLRMVADGLLQSVGRLGGVTGPLIRITRQVVPLLPSIIYSVIAITGSLILLFLPDTRGLPLPDTIQDLENQGTLFTSFKNQHQRETVLPS